jgi:hypothetical protein
MNKGQEGHIPDSLVIMTQKLPNGRIRVSYCDVCINEKDRVGTFFYQRAKKPLTLDFDHIISNFS